MAHRIAFTGKSRAELQEFEIPAPGPTEIILETLYSLMSPGTEGIAYARKFAEGTAWDEWVQYPFYPGYALIGKIAAIGSDVSGYAVGDRVATRHPHASHVVVDLENGFTTPVPVPEALSSREAAWFALAKIAYMGARAAGYSLGDSVAVIGAGAIGQLSARWALAAGATRVLVADPVASRLDFAVKGGIPSVFAGSVDELIGPKIEELLGEQPRVVIDGTGNADVFATALRLTKDHGKVVLLGDTGFPANQRLNGDLINRGLTVVGAHDMDADGPDQVRAIQLFFDLVASGRFDVSGLVTHEVLPEQAPDMYDLVQARPGDTLGIGFAWSNNE